MIKFIGAAIWICAVTIGAVVYAFQSSGTKAEAAAGATPPPLLGGLDYVKTAVISVPVMKDRGIEGYFLARFVYTAEQANLRKLSVPAETLITDQVYSFLFANPAIDFSRPKEMDLDAFRHGIRDSVNARIGEPLINEVMIEQMDFLSKSEIRANSGRGLPASPSDTKAPAPAPAAH
jgi:hypothetical protein